MTRPDPQGFSVLAARYAAAPDVELPAAGKKGFGSATLRCNAKIFAMSPDGESLVVKLPAARVAQLIAAGEAAAYSSGAGKIMKEWVTISAARAAAWAALADEALAFARGAGSSR